MKKLTKNRKKHTNVFADLSFYIALYFLGLIISIPFSFGDTFEIINNFVQPTVLHYLLGYLIIYPSIFAAIIFIIGLILSAIFTSYIIAELFYRIRNKKINSDDFESNRQLYLPA